MTPNWLKSIWSVPRFSRRAATRPAGGRQPHRLCREFEVLESRVVPALLDVSGSFLAVTTASISIPANRQDASTGPVSGTASGTSSADEEGSIPPFSSTTAKSTASFSLSASSSTGGLGFGSAFVNVSLSANAQVAGFGATGSASSIVRTVGPLEVVFEPDPLYNERPGDPIQLSIAGRTGGFNGAGGLSVGLPDATFNGGTPVVAQIGDEMTIDMSAATSAAGGPDSVRPHLSSPSPSPHARSISSPYRSGCPRAHPAPRTV
jgi:hypothetical protein